MRIPKQTVKNLIKNTQDLQELLSQAEQLNYEVCPFSVVLGSLNTTQTGYKNVYSNPNDYTAFSRVFTGQEAIIADWDESYSLTQNNPTLSDNPDPENYYGTKHFQVGVVFNALLLDDSIGIDFTPSPQNNNFTQEQVVKSVNMIIKNDETNTKFFDNLPSYYFKLFQIPRLNIEIETERPTGYNGVNAKRNPTLNVDKQWYYIQNATKYWDKSSKKIAYIVISFVSLNDKLSTTGLAINQYVQTGGPGEPTALPALVNETIQLDSDFLSPLPITHFQVTFYGFAGLSSVVFMGRPVVNNDIVDLVNYDIKPPREIYLFDGQAPIYDNLSLKGIPNNNYYWSYGSPTLDTYYSSWRDDIATKQLFDETNQKIFTGHWRDNKESTRDTNKRKNNSAFVTGDDDPSTNGSYFVDTQRFKDYWDFAFFIDVSDKTDEYKTFGNSYFNFTDNKDPNLNVGSLADNSFQFSKVNNNTGMTMSRMFFFNHILNSTTYEIPLTVHQTTPITLNSLPVVGSFLNKLTAGVPIGFKVVDADTPFVPSFFILLNAGMYNILVDYLYNVKDSGKYDGIIPLNIFDNTIDKIGALAGTYATNTAFAFNLTDKLEARRYNLKTKEANSTSSVINSVLLSQKYQPEGLDDPHTYLVDLSSVPTEKDDDTLGYLIDAIKIQSIGQVDYRIDFFSQTNPVSSDSPISYDDCVYTAKYQSFSKATKYSRFWTELKQLSNPTYNFEETFNYPQAVEPPKPENSNTFVVALDDSADFMPPWNSNSVNATWDLEPASGKGKDDIQWRTYICRSDENLLSGSNTSVLSNITLPTLQGFSPVQMKIRITFNNCDTQIKTTLNDLFRTMNFHTPNEIVLTFDLNNLETKEINIVGFDVEPSGKEFYVDQSVANSYKDYYWRSNNGSKPLDANLYFDFKLVLDTENIYNLEFTEASSRIRYEIVTNNDNLPTIPDETQIRFTQGNFDDQFTITANNIEVTYKLN